MRQPAVAGALLEGLVQGLGIASRLQQYQAWQVWDAVVGPQVAVHARPARIRDGVLEVRVDQAVWMQQLQLLKPKILAALEQRLGAGVIRDIFWRHGAIPPAAAPSRGEGAPALPPLSPADSARIEQLLAGLSDDDLRRSLRFLLQKQARLDAARDSAQPVADAPG